MFPIGPPRKLQPQRDGLALPLPPPGRLRDLRAQAAGATDGARPQGGPHPATFPRLPVRFHSAAMAHRQMGARGGPSRHERHGAGGHP